MQALDLLLSRHSQPRLIAPAPTGDALDNIMQAAMRAPDHAGLKPWQFLIVDEGGLEKLGSVFEADAIQKEKSEKDIARAPQLPMRAPMIIVAATRYQDHPKVPKEEQFASTACAVMAMQMAAVAQGFQGMWRTGGYAYSDSVKADLGIDVAEDIVGFLYLGTPALKAPERPQPDTTKFFKHWKGD